MKFEITPEMKVWEKAAKELPYINIRSSDYIELLTAVRSEAHSLIERSYGFEDIAIKQKKNLCKSRLDANIESEVIRGVKLKIPMMAANMLTVVNSQFCIKLAELGALGVMHRMAPKNHLVDEICQIRKVAKETEHVAASIGTNNEDYFLAVDLINAGANIIVIDIAHGYSDPVLEMGRKIKTNFPKIKIVVGNTTNTDLLMESLDFADAVKVGISGGLACTTKNTAGCGEKQFSTVLKFKELSRKYGMPIISDGGIREEADLVKALAAGASSVMAGSIFAVCPESSAELIENYDIDNNGLKVVNFVKKIYAGSSSEYVQNKWRGGLKPGTCAEGGVCYLDLGSPLEKLLENYSGALRSGITYGGGTDIKSFQEVVEFVRLS